VQHCSSIVRVWFSDLRRGSPDVVRFELPAYGLRNRCDLHGERTAAPEPALARLISIQAAIRQLTEEADALLVSLAGDGTIEEAAA